MKVLIIDNTLDADSWGSASLKSFVTRSKDRTAFVRRAPHGDLPDSVRGYDRIILSGSRASCREEGEWIASLDRLLKEALNEKKPILGVCYGHQSLNRVLGGTSILRTSPTPEFGWTKIEILAESPLFSGLPKSFWSFSSHSEEVTSLPKGMRLLARSENCAIQACQLEDRPVYGIQFHPERGLEAAKETFVKWKREKKPSLLHPRESDQLFQPEVGDAIFENFLR